MNIKKRVEIAVRLTVSEDSSLGRSLKYMKELGLDPKREIARLIECKFLSMALKHAGDEKGKIGSV